MADNTNNNDPVVVEDPVVDIEDNSQDNVSGSVSNNNIKYITIVASVAMSVIIYFLMFSGGTKEDIVDPNTIVRNDKKQISQTTGAIDDIDSLISINYNDTQFDNETNKELLELPELPELPENITQNIEQEIKDVKRQELPDNVFTKEEVDELIGMKLKSFETEMNKIKNESEKLAKELEKRKLEEEESKKKKKFSNVLGDQSAITPPVGNNEQTPPTAPTADTGGLPPNIGGDTIQSLEEQKAEEERQLKIAQRARIMQERKSSNMFKMKGGGGGDELEAEQDSIIITDKDSLHNIEETKTDIVTTKTSDLSRTISQGKIIAAVLENAINTDVQNQVRAIISRDIYSESGKNILIPKGSRVIGTYSSTASTTVARLDITWTRIIRSDGLNISISSTTADNLGRGGVEGDLDNKYTQIVKNAFLSSVVSIASAALVDKITDTVTTTTTNGTATTTTSNATNSAIIDATQTFGDEMQSIVDGLKEEKPTIRISQGTKINIVVNQDLTLPIFKSKGKYEKF